MMTDWVMNQFDSTADIISSGGPVMGPLIILSLVMWMLIIERIFFLGSLYRKNMSATIALDHIHAAQLPDPVKYQGAVSLLVTDFIQNRTGSPVLDQHILNASITRLNRSLTDFLAIIGVLAAVAPLLGLLGTVTGMMTTFDVLAVFGTGNSKAMAGGISEALITTQTGLIVAIPGLYMKNFLERRAVNLQQRISRVGLYLKHQL